VSPVAGLWEFSLLSVIITLTPGPDDVLVLRSSLRGGPRAGAATALGAGAGSLVWGSAAACGLAGLVTGSPAVYAVIRFSGAGYLLVLGLAPLVTRSGRMRARAFAQPSASGSCIQHRGGAFRIGLVSDLLNPKIGVFYLAIVPLFVPADAAVLPYALLLCAVDVAVAVTWLLLLARTAALVAGWLRRPAVAVWSDRSLSVALTVIGVAVAAGLP
jgi:threonine/homoserine/homoserine lactone efflux protein